MYVITNGKIILENEILLGHSILVNEDRIERVFPNSEIETYRHNLAIQSIDAEGGYISPGFIDIHSDYIEGIICPRPTAMMNFTFGIKEAERLLVTNGITTIFHSLSLYGNDIFEVKLLRQKENALKLIDTINENHGINHIIRNRVHARFEIDNLSMVSVVSDLIQKGKVNLLSIMDHTPGQGQYRNIETYKKTLKGYQDKLTEEEVENKVASRLTSAKMTIEDIITMAKLADNNGLAVASHDDDTLEKLEIVQSFNATISEFPITLEVAKAAKEKGMFTVAGAPNILMGKSHSGNLSATEGVIENAIDILVSDYYPPALVQSAFKLNQENQIPLNVMINKLTINPARAVRIDADYGSIEEGKKADLIIIQENDTFPDVVLSMVDGKIVYRLEYRV